jgi:hypothetical protein
MKKNFLILSTMLLYSFAFSQVGINTEAPNATLDVAANPTNLSKVDGFLAPRLSGNDLKAKDALYGNSQIGTIVYATAKVDSPSTKTANIVSEGYYFFNGSVWTALGSGGNSSAKEWFYAPSSVLPTTPLGVSTNTSDDINYNSSNETYTIKLFSIYNKQFGLTGDIAGTSRTSIKSSSSASLDVINSTDLDYFVLYFDNTVFDPSTIAINTSGELTYKILPSAVITEKTFMNIVFKRK